MKVLHITDFHLHSFDSGEELLRKGFYKEFVERLHDALKQKHNIENVDFLVVTGDFVDIGITANFSFVSEILNHLKSVFNIEDNNICLCIGNHDYKWKTRVDIDFSDEVALKEDYINFSNVYDKSVLVQSENFILKKLTENTFFLSLDSTWKSVNGCPGEFSIEEEDTLIEALRKYVNEESILLAGSHFPIISIPNNFLALEEDNWHEKHTWIKGSTIRDRIRKLKFKNIIWFHGDVHASDQQIIEHEIFLLTSKFGGNFDPSEQHRQAVLLLIDEEEISSITCNYNFPAHNPNPRLGDWSCSEKKHIRERIPVLTQGDSNEKESLKPISKEIEVAIINIIKEKKLYQFGRFHTNDEYVSLGWVDITKLLSEKDLLNRITDKCFTSINELVSTSNDKVLFLGLEIIGGIISSQLSVRFNVKNSIIPIRNKNDHYTLQETSFSKEFEDLSKFEEIVIIIDIVSSGKTITNLVKELLEKNHLIKIHIISIISNNIKDKHFQVANVISYSTFCTSLKIPLVNHDLLPEESLVNINLSYIR